MKPEQKVADREYCKKIQELGIIIETEKVWVELRNMKFGTIISAELFGIKHPFSFYKIDINPKFGSSSYYTFRYPAPDGDELGEVLPKKVERSGVTYRLDIFSMREQTRKWQIQYVSYNGSNLGWISKEIKESNARILMLIYLKENDLCQV